jgi:hypothetical protein
MDQNQERANVPYQSLDLLKNQRATSYTQKKGDRKPERIVENITIGAGKNIRWDWISAERNCLGFFVWRSVIAGDQNKK